MSSFNLNNHFSTFWKRFLHGSSLRHSFTMFAHFGYQSLALSILFGNTIALDLNTNSQGNYAPGAP